jgi:hypothetical protein
MPASIRIAFATPCLALLAIALLASPVLAQQVYSWKDAKGVTHYSDSPPPESATKARTIAVPPSPPPVANVQPGTPPARASTAVAAPAVQTPDPAAAQALADQRAAQCKRAQENLRVLQTNAAVAVDNDGDGKNDAVLNAEERTAQTASMQAAIQATCTQ